MLVLKDEYEGKTNIDEGMFVDDGFIDEIKVLKRRMKLFLVHYNKILHERNLVWDNFNLIFPSRLPKELFEDRALFKSGESEVLESVWNSDICDDIAKVVFHYHDIVEINDQIQTAGFKFFYPRFKEKV